MNLLFKLVFWELKLAYRYKIILVSIFLALSYIIVLNYFRDDPINEFLILMIFSDPVMLGFTFIGAMVLFEKNANTLAAIATSPLQVWQYLWSKGITYTLLAVLISVAIMVSGHSGNVNYFFLLLSVSLTSLFFIFLGFIGSIHVKTFNQYILVIPLIIIPVCLPLLDLFNIYNHWIFYFIPTHASILLLKASVGNITAFDMIYSIFYLLISITVSFLMAGSTFSNYISTRN